MILHVLPLLGSQHIAQTFILDAVPSAIHLPPQLQCIINFFTLQPLPAQHNWIEAYQQDSETKLFLHHFSINNPLDQSTIRSLPAAYRTTISQNQIGLLRSRFVYYEHISFAHKHICRIVVHLSLRSKILVLIHASPIAGHMDEHKTLYRIRLRFFRHRMRVYIKEWIQQCPNSILTYR